MAVDHPGIRVADFSGGAGLGSPGQVPLHVLAAGCDGRTRRRSKRADPMRPDDGGGREVFSGGRRVYSADEWRPHEGGAGGWASPDFGF